MTRLLVKIRCERCGSVHREDIGSYYGKSIGDKGKVEGLCLGCKFENWKELEAKGYQLLGFGDLLIGANKGEWEEAVIVFTESSFDKYYPEISRSYKVSSDAKYFDSSMGGTSLFGNCLDGKDDLARLDIYIQNGWTVDYCYTIK